MDATYLTDANGTTAPNGRQTSLVIGPITGATISPLVPSAPHKSDHARRVGVRAPIRQEADDAVPASMCPPSSPSRLEVTALSDGVG